jgi:hypothetical protein
MRAISGYDRFKAILPYASEIFGVYQPMIGWKSKRQLTRVARGLDDVSIVGMLDIYDPDVEIFYSDFVPQLGHVLPAKLNIGRPIPQNDSLLLMSVAKDLTNVSRPTSLEDWLPIFIDITFERRLRDDVFPEWSKQVVAELVRINGEFQQRPNETPEQAQLRLDILMADAKNAAQQRLERESIIAKLLYDLMDSRDVATLDRIFYGSRHPLEPLNIQKLRELVEMRQQAYEDPFLLFRPHQDIQDVSLSPIGIVHLFRQYFFEFDTFLGPPVGHVWLSPGASVELIETSTRRTLTERTVETLLESVSKSESSATDQEEISDAVKQDNREDTKLGVTSTVNQSWGSGSATATASLNMDRTQQVARENTHKRMREQTEKLSTEIRQNYKTSFKTVTEVTDTSSKRYVLSNATTDLLNYEMRRKMRQVGVQVQDIGTYLCWQTFVDEPGRALGLSNLVHIAQPADLVPQPNQKKVSYPPRIPKSFEVGTVWDFGSERKRNDPKLGYIPLDTVALPFQVDSGYEIEPPPGDRLALNIRSINGEEAGGQRWNFTGRFVGSNQIQIGVIADASGLRVKERIDYVLVGELVMVPTAAEKSAIDTSNAKIDVDIGAANREQERATQEAFFKAATERIEQASKVKARKFEDLREEERTIVYRALIKELLTAQFYYLPEGDANQETRHVLSELINSIFDIDKMLYFVAPEWWKPRKHYGQFVGKHAGAGKILGKKTKPKVHGVLGNELVTNWSDNEIRQDNYYITNDSDPARLGSSLGWLLQLDGDNHRNAFLNAPWVKAVIPIRPGKEQAATNWLQQVNVEGADGLTNNYSAPAAELDQIKEGLLAHNPSDPVADHPTIGDALRYLCLLVSRKHAESVEVKKFPNVSGISDDDKVSATPVEKVFEHGFYPLQEGFRVNPSNPDPGNPDKNFQIFDQWVEVLPTDQVVPVPVAYDPQTGRQV